MPLKRKRIKTFAYTGPDRRRGQIGDVRHNVGTDKRTEITMEDWRFERLEAPKPKGRERYKRVVGQPNQMRQVVEFTARRKSDKPKKK